jgi:hypothetical protein
VEPELEGRPDISLSYSKAPGAVSVMSAAISDNIGRFAEQYAGDIGDYDVSTVRFLGNTGLFIIGEAAVCAVVPFDDYFITVTGATERDVRNFLDEFTVES